MFAIVVKFVDGSIEYYGPFSSIHTCNQFGLTLVQTKAGAYSFHSVRINNPIRSGVDA